MNQDALSITAKRRQRERQERIKLIRDAGIRVFARHGYAGATMAQVAAEAELGKASLYYYFETKQALFTEIIKHAVSDLSQQLNQIVQHPADPFEQLSRLGKFFIEMFDSDKDRLALFLPLIASGPEHLIEMLGPQAAMEIGSEVSKTHQPMFRNLSALTPNKKEETVLRQLVNTFFLGLATKMVHGSGAERFRELTLFIQLLQRAYPQPKKGQKRE